MDLAECRRQPNGDAHKACRQFVSEKSFEPRILVRTISKLLFAVRHFVTLAPDCRLHTSLPPVHASEMPSRQGTTLWFTAPIHLKLLKERCGRDR